MAPRFFGRGRRLDADPLAAGVLAERAVVADFVNQTFGSTLPPAELLAVMQLVDASSPRALLVVVQQNPWLASQRGQAEFRRLATAAQLLQLRLLPALIEDRRDWLAQLVESGVRPENLRLPE